MSLRHGVSGPLKLFFVLATQEHLRVKQSLLVPEDCSCVEMAKRFVESPIQELPVK